MMTPEENKNVTDPLPNFNKVSISRVESDLNSEYLDLRAGYDTAKAYRLQQWREYAFQPYGNEKDGASKIIDSTIFNAIEWMVPTLIQPFTQTDSLIDVSPNGGDARSLITAGVLKELLNYQIKKRMNLYEFLYDSIKTFLIGGTSYMKLTWIDKNLGKNEPVGRPTFTSVNPDQIRYDWTAKCFADSHVVTQDEEWTRTEVLEWFEKQNGNTLIKSRKDMVLASPGRGTKAARLREEQQDSKNYVGETTVAPSSSMGLYLRREQWTMYDVDGDGKAVPVLCVFFDDILVQVVKNPYDFQTPPFVAAECVRDPLGNPASGWAANLSDIQKFRTGLMRMLSDNLNAQQNGLYEVDRTNVDDIGFQLLRHAPQGSRVPIPVRKPGSINPLAPAPIAQHAFTAWEMLAVEGENRSGNTRYSQGLDSGSLNQTATGIVTITQRSEMRMWEVATRFAESAFKPLIRMTIALNQQKLDKMDLQLQFGVDTHDTELKEMSEFFGQKHTFQPGEWITLNRKDIGGFFSVDLDVMVGSDRQTKINNMLSYMQYVAPYVGQAVPAEVITTIAIELAKEMGLPNIQGLMKDQYVGTRGVSVPRSYFPDQSGGVPNPTAQGGSPSQGGAGAQGQGGAIPAELADTAGLPAGI